MEEDIKQFIFKATGLYLIEEDNNEKYTLKLGNYNPLELGFYKKKHPNMPYSEMRFSAHLKMLNVLTSQMMDWDTFQNWCKMENSKKN